MRRHLRFQKASGQSIQPKASLRFFRNLRLDLYVIWVFSRSEGFELYGKTPADDKPHGLFATRSPRRPNPIALTVVELLGREGRRLRVRGVDMLDGTPILDIKPYLSSIPEEKLRRGWLADAEARKAAK
jgi:tRNA (adenine37-N6)-methyltransferase